MRTIAMLFTLCASIFTFSQTISGKIISYATQTPLAFSTIGILGEQIGTQTNEKGEFTLDLKNVSQDKILMVDVAGYDVYKKNIGEFLKTKPYTIALKEKETAIDEVKLTPKKYKESNWGINARTKKILYSISKRDSSNLKETVIEFNSKKLVKINKIYLNIAEMNIEEPVQVRMVVYNDNNGFPGELILENELVKTLSANEIKDGTFSIDASESSIWMKGKFYVGFQFVGQVKGFVFISAALMRTGYIRKFYDKWTKHTIAAPAINIDVKVEK